MYIGPWQEYRLAKLQDDAIQRLRREWEDQLRGELPEGDDARHVRSPDDARCTRSIKLRELMQPLVDKLPALLLSAKPSTRAKRREAAASDRSSARPGSAASTESHRTHSRRSERPDRQLESGNGIDSAKTTKPSSNQETHDAAAAGDKPPLAPRAKPARRKPKKPSTAPLTALEQVQKRKRMFAKWIKHASSSSDGSNNTTPDSSAREEESPAPDCRPADDNEEHEVDNAAHGVQLPPLSPSQPPLDAARSLQTNRGTAPGRTSQTRLPPIAHASRATASAGWDLVCESLAAGGTSAAASSSSDPSSSPHATTGATTPIETAACDLDDSLDEDEVNNFLSWTDTLACPNDVDLDDSSLLDE